MLGSIFWLLNLGILIFLVLIIFTTIKLCIEAIKGGYKGTSTYYSDDSYSSYSSKNKKSSSSSWFDTSSPSKPTRSKSSPSAEDLLDDDCAGCSSNCDTH